MRMLHVALAILVVSGPDAFAQSNRKQAPKSLAPIAEPWQHVVDPDIPNRTPTPPVFNCVGGMERWIYKPERNCGNVRGR